MQLFYHTEINFNQNLVLPEDEARHIIKVLRYKLGDKLFFTNGNGFLFEGELINDNYKSCTIKWLNKSIGNDKTSCHLHIALAPTKNIDRLEWFVEKATELGINEITPLICANSEKFSLKHERLQKLAISAIKQANRTFLPTINATTTFKEFMETKNRGSIYIAHCYNFKKIHLKNVEVLNSEITVLIGPEGDFSEKEIEVALNKKAIAISLGTTRLRTETAALKACCIVNLLNEE